MVKYYQTRTRDLFGPSENADSPGGEEKSGAKKTTGIKEGVQVRISRFFSLLLSLLPSLETMGILDIVPPGVITGDNVRKLFAYGMNYTRYTSQLCFGF